MPRSASALSFDTRLEADKAVVERHNLEIAVAAGQIALHDVLAQRDRARSNEAAAKVRLGELEAEASRERARIAILAARAENLEESLRSADSAKEKAAKAKSVAELTNSLATERSTVRELEERLRRVAHEQQTLRESLERAQVSQEEGRRRLAETESRLERSERIRGEMLIENGRLLAALGDRDATPRTPPARALERGASLDATSEEARANERAQAATTKGSVRAARANLEALRRENETLRARILVLASTRDAAESTALRTAIEHLGREVNRLFAGRKSIDQNGGDPRERMLSSQEDMTAIVGSPSAEARGLPDPPRRRASGSNALDR